MVLIIEAHDNAGVVHKCFQLDFYKWHTLEKLKQEIYWKWLISERYHRLFTENGEELVGPDETSLEALEVENGSKLILKHAHSQLWDEYKECVDLVLVKKVNKAENAKKAVNLCKTLRYHSFFTLYDSFNKFQKESYDEVAYWAYEGIQMIQKATKDYFHNLHDQKRGSENSELTCHFKSLKHALVQIHGEDSVTEYKLNCRYLDDNGTGNSFCDPDFVDLYCYKLLSLIGVCPKTYIIPPTKFSGKKTSTYIAIQWDDMFERLDDDENNTCADVVVQLSMLEVLLYVYTERYYVQGGRWKGTKNAAIVNFIPNGNDMFEISSNIKQKVLEQIRYLGNYNEKHDDSYWLHLAKVYMDKWDLSSKIELAREQLEPTNALLKDPEDLEYATNQLNEYINILNKNVENLQTVLSSIVL